METSLVILPNNHAVAIHLMHPHAAGLMKAKYEGQKIVKMTPEEAVPMIREAIQDCFKSLGHWNSAEDEEVLKHQTTEMVVYFLRDFKNLTLQEFKIILRNMVKGDYRVKETDLITCTVQSMCHAIKSYLASQEYKMAFNDYHTRLKLDATQKKYPTKEEQDHIVQRGLEEAILKFKETGEFPPARLCHIFFGYLKRKGEIVLTDEERETYLNQAQLALQANLNSNRGAMRGNQFKSAMDKIMNRGKGVTNKAKELVFKDYLRNLKG